MFVFDGRKCPHNPVAEIWKIEAAVLFTIAERTVVCFRWHLGQAGKRKDCYHLVRDYHYDSE